MPLLRSLLPATRVPSTLLTLLLASSSAHATNMATTGITLDLTLVGVFLSNDDPAVLDDDWEVGSADSSGFPGLFELGTGSQTSSGSVAINGTDILLDNSVLVNDVITISIATAAEATGAGSEYTGGHREETTLQFTVLANDVVSFVFDYSFLWSIDGDAPDPGQAVGSVEGFADFDLDGFIDTLSGAERYVDEAFNNVTIGNTETGQFTFAIDNTAGDNDFLEILFITDGSSNARVIAVPEPAAALLLLAGASLLALRGPARR